MSQVEGTTSRMLNEKIPMERPNTVCMDLNDCGSGFVFGKHVVVPTAAARRSKSMIEASLL
jgi:hypothetical protein